MDPVMIAWMTFPDEGIARQIGTALVERQCVACVNLIPGVRSIYRWEGKLEEEGEVLAMAKTTASRIQMLKQTVQEMHPYDCPELLIVEATDGLPAYLDWVRG